MGNRGKRWVSSDSQLPDGSGYLGLAGVPRCLYLWKYLPELFRDSHRKHVTVAILQTIASTLILVTDYPSQILVTYLVISLLQLFIGYSFLELSVTQNGS